MSPPFPRTTRSAHRSQVSPGPRARVPIPQSDARSDGTRVCVDLRPEHAAGTASTRRHRIEGPWVQIPPPRPARCPNLRKRGQGIDVCGWPTRPPLGNPSLSSRVFPVQVGFVVSSGVSRASRDASRQRGPEVLIPSAPHKQALTRGDVVVTSMMLGVVPLHPRKPLALPFRRASRARALISYRDDSWERGGSLRPYPGSNAVTILRVIGWVVAPPGSDQHRPGADCCLVLFGVHRHRFRCSQYPPGLATFGGPWVAVVLTSVVGGRFSRLVCRALVRICGLWWNRVACIFCCVLFVMARHRGLPPVGACVCRPNSLRRWMSRLATVTPGPDRRLEVPCSIR